jgi:hypothetical protein
MYKFKKIFQISFLILLLLILAKPGNTQVPIISLDLSRFNFRIDAEDIGVVEYDENEHCGMFPNGTYYMWTISNIKEHMLFGHIILANGEEQRNYGAKLGGGYFLEPPFGIFEYEKYPRPTVFVDGIQSTSTPKSTIDPNIKADKMFVVYKKESPWMHIRYEGYQFVNQYYGDFTILKTTYKLTFDDDHLPATDPDPDADTTQTVEDFYIFKAYRCSQTSYTGITHLDPSGSWFIHHGAMWASTMFVPTVVPGCDRNQLIVTYGWNGNHPDLTTFITGGPLFDTTGYPRFSPLPDGVLCSTPYTGFTLLHCDKSPLDKSDWVDNQPHSSRVRINFTNERGDAQWPGSKTTWDYFIPSGSGIYEISTLEDGSDPNPLTIEGKQPAQIWGGWDMVKDDSVTTVHVVGSGSISRKEAREVGKAWAKWYEFGDVPEAYYDDPKLGYALVTDQVKNQILARGKDSLSLAMQRAQELWENDLVCPRPYPSPDLYVTSGPYSVTLEWDDMTQKYPDHEGGKVIAYRIYRKKGHADDEYPTEAGKNLFWEMIKEIPTELLIKSDKGLFVYIDAGLSIGEDYHYAVTTVSDKQCGINGTGPLLESSKWSNRSILPARPIIPGKGHLDSIAVVPNPFYIYGQQMNFASDNNRLMFVNLPPYCTLRIYNTTGDLIHTIYHDDGSSNDFWDQITQSNKFIASGVYILVVDDAKKLVADEQGNLTIPQELPGEKAIIKFTIIR